MNIEQHLTSFELSRKLHEAGFVRESQFCWVSKDGKNWALVYTDGYNWEDWPGYVNFQHKIPAYLSSELGDALPWYVPDDEQQDRTWEPYYKACGFHQKTDGTYVAKYEIREGENKCDLTCFEDKTEANARAKLLLYLIKNQLITL